MLRHSRKDSRRKHTGRSRSGMSTAAECAEPRLLLSAASVDGVGHNVQNPQWESTDELLLRLASSEYADGVSAVAGEDRPSARLISNVVSDSGGKNVISDRLMSAMIYTWGQFIDHDMTLTKSGTTENMSIPVPIGDSSFDPLSTGTKTIDSMRSGFDESTGTSSANPREQVNLITAFLDASMVYGSDSETAASLRTFSGGKMKTSEGDLLPTGDGGMFLAGDVRVNENPGLTSLQTLFVREHNRLAEKIAGSNSGLSDEQIFQKARSVVAAEIQAITYNEWLPSLLGRGALDKYTGYDAAINPGISNEFATAAFRFGHSLLGDEVEFFNNDGQPIREGVSLSQAFFNPALVTENGIDSVLKYLTADPSSEVDTQVVDGVRNFLFGPPGAGGLDLASLNIQRGRDHGLADYNETRKAIGLPKVTRFAEITSDKAMQAKLQSLYGTVDNIDLWVGGLAEDHVRGSSVGRTFQTIIVDQFERLRDGDRYWYQNQFSGQRLSQLQKTSLSDIIERNTTLTSIQHNAFFFKAGIAGIVTADLNGNGRSDRAEPPLPKVQMQLINTEDGSVVATTVTDRRGAYRFGVENGLRTGVYQIKAVKPDGTVLVSSRKIHITGGDDSERVSLAVPAPVRPADSPARPASTRPTPPTRPTNMNSISAQTGTRPGPGVKESDQQPSTLAGMTSVTKSSSAASTATSTTPKKARSGSRSATDQVVPNTFTSSSASSTSADLYATLDSLFAALPPGLL